MLHRRLLPYAIIFLSVEFGLRLSLIARAFFDVEFDSGTIMRVLGLGLWFDVVTLSFCLLPPALYYLLLPARKHGLAFDRRFDAGFRFVFSYMLLFGAVAEHLFWSEFTTRFNFIAVDYLIYTQEVIGNIVESYPLPLMLCAIALGAAFLAWASLRQMPLPAAGPRRLRARFSHMLALAALSGALYMAASFEQARFEDNAEAGELAANGIYNLFYAFWHNEISYERFYATDSTADAAHNARNLMWEEESEFLHDDGQDLTRVITVPAPEQHKNVMLVVMESLSADYMQAFGNDKNLTPNLDRLAKEGLFFTDLYATGTRTVRGLEAVTLSIPPTPGQSIIRRPGNENLFSLGFVFKDRGYDTSFIYGGYGYFDNMNAFFAGNGFDVLDRTDVPKGEISFANVWGICDEDMFMQAIKSGDRSFAAKRPFMQLIMTTSNHRPYTYPDGKIDIESHQGRMGGVKYADYSIGRLIEEARTKPWFKDTVFVFVADHTAGAGGKAELDARKYRIPLIYYAPGFIAPERFENTASQIDVAPMLLGMLDFSYYTKFYGEDLLHDDDEIPHAFISNYQKVALVKDGKITVLAPNRKSEQYSWPAYNAEPEGDRAELRDAIAYYQSASWWREQYKRVPTVVAK